MNYIDLLKAQFNNRIAFREKRPGVLQLVAPLYHEDGDMIDIYLREVKDRGTVCVSDFGMTLMRLSYSFDVDTPSEFSTASLPRIGSTKKTAPCLSKLGPNRCILPSCNSHRPLPRSRI